MSNTINMQDMRYLNLFGKITKINTRFYFIYNDTVFFCVPKNLVSKAIGEQGKNVKIMHNLLGKRIKIIPVPLELYHVKPFIQAIVAPVTFKNIEVSEGEVILTAGGTQSKAMLFGRNKARLLEMQKIIKDFFNKDFRIV